MTNWWPEVVKEPSGKKRVLIVADVPNWAWAKKAEQLKKHITEFEIDIIYTTRDKLIPNYDLYHTFEFIQIQNIPAPWKSVTGITAHVWQTWEQKHNPGTVRGWASLANGVHANSKLLQHEMEEYLQQPIYYVPNGVDETFFTRTRPQSSKELVVGFVGKPNPRKGHAIVQKACFKAGVELRALQRNSHTALTSEEVREFYQDIHVLAVASDMDGTPNPALEAAACGCAVVANRIGNMPEFINHGVNGLEVRRNSDSLANAFRDLAEDMPRTLAMGQAARATIEADWTWKKLAQNYATMWREVLAK